MTDYDIFGGAVYPKAIFTATGFQRKTVVATAQRTILHQHMARRLDVDAVAPGYPHRRDRDAAYDDRVAIDRHHIPERGVLKCNTLDIDLPAIYRRKEHGQKYASTSTAVVETILDRRVGIDKILNDIALHLPSLYFAIARRPHQPALPGKGYVPLATGIYQRAQRIDLYTLLPGKDRRLIVDHLAGEMQLGPFAQMQVDITQQLDAPRVPYTGRDYHPASAPFMHIGNGPSYCPRSHRPATCAVIGNRDRQRGEHRLFEKGKVKRSLHRGYRIGQCSSTYLLFHRYGRTP